MNNEQYLKDFNEIDWKPHLDVNGAPNRGKLTSYMRFVWWVKKATDTFNNKFTYNFDTWINANSKTEVTCPIHGTYSVNARAHLCSKGCPSCVKNLPATGGSVQLWKNKLKVFQDNNPNVTIHWPDLPEYKGTTEISYTCDLHGKHTTTMWSLFLSKRCIKCYREVTLDSIRLQEHEIVELAGKIPNSIYKSSYILYGRSFAKLECSICGELHNIRVHNLRSGNTTALRCKSSCMNKVPHNKKDLAQVQNEHAEKLNLRGIEIVEYKNTSEVKFHCLNCNNTWTTSIGHVVKEYTGCPNCNTKLQKCFVYLLHDSELDIYKIGLSVKPEQRAHILNRKNNVNFHVLGTIECENSNAARIIESQLHNKYAQYGIVVNWFIDGGTELFSAEGATEYAEEFKL